MKNLILSLAAMLMMLSSVHAQNENAKSVSVKTYFGINYSPGGSYIDGDFYSSRSIDVGFSSFALARNNSKGNFHQMELIKPYVMSENDFLGMVGLHHSGLGFGLRYNYNIGILKSKVKKIQPFIGAGVHSYYFYSKNIWSEPNSYTSFGSRLLCEAEIVPRLVYRITPRISFDVNVPVTLITFVSYHSRDLNSPASSPSQKSNNSYLDGLGPLYFSGKIGVAFNL